MIRDSNGLCTVDIRNRQREVRFSVDSNTLQGIVQAVLDSQQQKASQVGIHFLSDRATRLLHKQFFSDPSSTDCMSFPIDQVPDSTKYRHLGDVIVCPATAFSCAQGNAAVFWEELTLYIVHGLLHLLGYDDTTTKKRAVMRREEQRALLLAKKRSLVLHGPVYIHKRTPNVCIIRNAKKQGKRFRTPDRNFRELALV